MSSEQADLKAQLAEAEAELAFALRMHVRYRITERVALAMRRVQELRAAVSA